MRTDCFSLDKATIAERGSLTWIGAVQKKDVEAATAQMQGNRDADHARPEHQY